MPTTISRNLLRQLHQVIRRQDHADVTDGQLLDQFLQQGEEVAFTELVRRYGPMVLGVCRRLLRNHHDAEDAFQAAFLVLWRKAPSLRSRPTIGNWLYGVAYHTALKARAALRKRQAKESQVRRSAVPVPLDSFVDLQPWLDYALSRLPEKYRTAVVLCELQGLSRREAAHRLGIPEGTLSSRLAMARRLLAKRLVAQGATFASGVLVTMLAPNVATASVPPWLVVSTVNAVTSVGAGKAEAQGLLKAQAAAWSKGVLQAMFLKKLKTTAGVLLFTALMVLLATSFLWPYTAVAQSEQKPAETKQPTAKSGTAVVPAKPEKKLSKLEIIANGNRVMVQVLVDGELYSAEADRVRYDEKTGILTLEGRGSIGVRLLKHGKDPMEIRTNRALYSTKENKLQCVMDEKSP